MTERSCLNCRYGVSAFTGAGGEARADCIWVLAEDEGGDRAPRWVLEATRMHPDANGLADRAEECPAYEEKP